MERIETIRQPAHWRSLKDFTASTTFSEKVWRVVNDLVFVTAGFSLYAIATKRIRQAPPALSYACYATLSLTVRKIVSAAIGYAVYPASRDSLLVQLALDEELAVQKLKMQDFFTQKITLHKSGVAYAATLIEHKDSIDNRKWSVHALGNNSTMEGWMYNIAVENQAYKANTLLINGPSVGHSKGYPTRYQMGAGFEAGLQFLEKEVKATHIVFKGLSLGGGMMAEAVLAHEFDLSKFNYLGISDCTFSRLSDCVTTFVGFIAIPFFYLSGAELDGVSGAEKLEKLKIQHIIIQHNSVANCGTDGVIHDRVSLAPVLKECRSRTFLLSPGITHNGDLPDLIRTQLDEEINDFFNN